MNSQYLLIDSRVKLVFVQKIMENCVQAYIYSVSRNVANRV